MAFRRKAKTQKSPQSTLSKVGALWKGKGKKGGFLSGRIELGEHEEMKIMVFENNYKYEGERRPDYIVYEIADYNEESRARAADDFIA